MLTAEQMEQRRTGIGASEVPAVLGIDPYRSPLDVFLEKTGALPAFEGNSFTEWGNRLEPVLAAAYADQIGEVRLKASDTLTHREHSWALATPDRFVWSESFDSAGLPWLLECKNRGAYANAQFGEPGTDQVPDHIAAQCHWQMFVTNLNRCDVAVLLGGNDFRIYELHRDPAIEGPMVEFVADFWHDNVLKEVHPQPRATDADTVKRLFPQSDANMLDGEADQYEVCRLLHEAKAELKSLEAEVDGMTAQVKLMIGDHAGLRFPDGSKATWKSTKASRRIDWEAVARAAGASDQLIAEHTREVPGYRRFLLSMKEGAN